MALQSYELTAEILESGNRYAVVTLSDGSTFGQIVEPGDLADIDQQIESSVARYEREQARSEQPILSPVTRTAADIQAAKQAKE